MMTVVTSRPCIVWLLVASGCVADDGADPAASDDGPAMTVPAGPVTLAFGGDAMLGRAFNGLLSDEPDYEVWRGFADPLAGTDILAFNLETTITAHEEKWEGKKWNFKLDPALGDAALGAVLRDHGVPAGFASTANNHTLDFQVPGMLETIDSLDGFGMAHAGSGLTAETARAPAIIETATGVRVAFFAASTVCSCGDVSLWNAGEQTPGAWMIASGDDDGWQEAVDAVRATAATVDYVVFSLHWGVNYVEAWPVDWMRERGAQLVDAGVDVIYGHSAHHVLPIERVGNGVVLYGTGDFIDDYSGVEGFRNDLSYVGRITLHPDRDPDVSAIPMRLEHDPGHFGLRLDTDDPDFAAVMNATGLP